MAESWKQRLQRGANAMLHPLGLHLQRRERTFDMDGLLARAAGRGPAIETWIDVGASNGSWSLRARRHFPRASFVLFEPLAERQAALAQLREIYGFEIIAAAAGARSGDVAFSVDDQLDGSGVATLDTAGARVVAMESVDATIERLRSKGPYGLKLDTHGFELPVLEGASRVLRDAALLVIEAYAFQLNPGCLRFHELCSWLEARGFRCCDLADPMRRPGDGALWQMDLAFAPASSPIFLRATYD